MFANIYCIFIQSAARTNSSWRHTVNAASRLRARAATSIHQLFHLDRHGSPQPPCQLSDDWFVTSTSLRLERLDLAPSPCAPPPPEGERRDGSLGVKQRGAAEEPWLANQPLHRSRLAQLRAARSLVFHKMFGEAFF